MAQNEETTITHSSFKNKRIKISLVLVIYIIWIMCRIFVDKSTKDNIIDLYCFKDVLIVGLTGLTNLISQSLEIRDFILIISGFLLDLYFFLFFLFFIKEGKSWKHVISLFLFYFIRGIIIQKLFLFNFYDTYLFIYPGFSSFVVPYYRSADFFFSGHAGIIVLIGLILRDYNQKFFFILSLFLATYEGFTLIVMRAHYVIDIIFGVMAGHYIYIISSVIGEYLDKVFPFWGEINNSNSNEYRNSFRNDIDSDKDTDKKLEMNIYLIDKTIHKSNIEKINQNDIEEDKTSIL